MNYFENEKNIRDYIKMAEGYDGAELIKVLRDYLPEHSTVLELGMGPGTDLDILKKTYTVTGSDVSQIFIDLYKQKNPHADLMQLDAVTIDTDRTFDCIYSNKVLSHLTRLELSKSLDRQREMLQTNGLLFHSFWAGRGEEEFHGLLFAYYSKDDLTKLVRDDFDILLMEHYTEMKKNDSIYLLLRQKMN